MAQYRSNKRNPFDDDEDDSSFKPTARGKNPFEDEEEDKFEDIGKSPELLRLRQEKDLLEQRMIDSSYRSISMITESQQIASETGDSLHVQREKLERTNKTLDKMQDDLNETDRNINGLKSIWGTMSNWFKKPLKKSTAAGSESPESGDKDSVNGVKQTNNDIQKNLRGLDKINVEEPHSARIGGMQRYGEPTSVDDIVDNNLDQMLAGLTMLKHQGLELGTEIDSQNKLLDDIATKVEKTDTKIGSQDNKIRKILK